MTFQATFEQWVPFPLERVFLFFADPGNLPHIMPPATDTRLDRLALVQPAPPGSSLPGTALAGVGSVIVTSFRPLPALPFRAPWIARITEFEWNHHFADVQDRGPFRRFHHRHEFSAEERDGVSGTIVRDCIEYEVGFGLLGAIAQKLFVGRQITRTFLHRQRVLEGLLLEAGNRSPPE
jgi:ligand-binding SRPBCC domain-containing protein